MYKPIPSNESSRYIAIVRLIASVVVFHLHRCDHPKNGMISDKNNLSQQPVSSAPLCEQFV